MLNEVSFPIIQYIRWKNSRCTSAFPLCWWEEGWISPLPTGCLWASQSAAASSRLTSTGGKLGSLSKPEDSQIATGSWQIRVGGKFLTRASPPYVSALFTFPLTVTMRILKSISSLSLLQTLECFEMKNDSGVRSQGRDRKDVGRV